MIVAARPKLLPARLRKLARKAGQEPAEYLAGVLATHPTYGEAAEALDVDRRTVYRWRRAAGIEVITSPCGSDLSGSESDTNGVD